MVQPLIPDDVVSTFKFLNSEAERWDRQAFNAAFVFFLGRLSLALVEGEDIEAGVPAFNLSFVVSAISLDSADTAQEKAEAAKKAAGNAFSKSGDGAAFSYWCILSYCFGYVSDGSKKHLSHAADAYLSSVETLLSDQDEVETSNEVRNIEVLVEVGAQPAQGDAFLYDVASWGQSVPLGKALSPFGY